MWIRSQDKTKLVKCDFIEVGGNNIIYAITKGEAVNLGTYSTKEKALKVLDMIQSAIIRNGIIYAHEYSGSGVRDYDIFQMPQDKEVE